MARIEYFKDKDFFTVFLWEGLFLKGKIAKTQNSIIELLASFDFSTLTVHCDFFVYGGDVNFLNEIENITESKAITIFQQGKQPSKGIFRQKEAYKKMKIEFNGSLISEVVQFALRNEEHIGIFGFDDRNAVCVKIDLFDNDGSCISFNRKKYDERAIRERTSRVFGF